MGEWQGEDLRARRVTRSKDAARSAFVREAL